MAKFKYTTCSGVWFPTRENLKNSINELIKDYELMSDSNTVYTVLYVHQKYEEVPDRIINQALRLFAEGKKLRVFCIWRFNNREMRIALNHLWIR